MGTVDFVTSRVGIYLRRPASCSTGKPDIKCDTLFDPHLPFSVLSSEIADVSCRSMVRRANHYDPILLSLPSTGSSMAMLNLDLRRLGISVMAELCES